MQSVCDEAWFRFHERVSSQNIRYLSYIREVSIRDLVSTLRACVGRYFQLLFKKGRIILLFYGAILASYRPSRLAHVCESCTFCREPVGDSCVCQLPHCVWIWMKGSGEKPCEVGAALSARGRGDMTETVAIWNAIWPHHSATSRRRKDRNCCPPGGTMNVVNM
jgi:hypothetical protein